MPKGARPGPRPGAQHARAGRVGQERAQARQRKQEPCGALEQGSSKSGCFPSKVTLQPREEGVRVRDGGERKARPGQSGDQLQT